MVSKNKAALLRTIPSVSKLLLSPEACALSKDLTQNVVTNLIRESVSEVREGILDGSIKKFNESTIIASAFLKGIELQAPSHCRAINATGMVFHPSLGGARIPEEASSAQSTASRQFVSLTGKPQTPVIHGSKTSHCEEVICKLAGCEAALVTNCDAAAFLLVLSEFASNRSVVVSRGEMIEPEDHLSLIDIAAISNTTITEVGTTNRTYADDYKRAITPDTSLLVKIESAGFHIVGFHSEASVRSLHAIAFNENERRHNLGTALSSDSRFDLLVYEDLATGPLAPISGCESAYRQTARDALKQGADLVSCSGDKLLGGPESGILMGSKDLIDRLKRNPLSQIVRASAPTATALDATLRLFLRNDAAKRIPALSMLTADDQSLKTKADRVALLVKGAVAAHAQVNVVEDASFAGGESLPFYSLRSPLVLIDFKQGSAEDCIHYLSHERSVPIFAATRRHKLAIDVRTLLDDDEALEVARALGDYFKYANRVSARRNAKNVAQPSSSFAPINL